MVNNSARRTRAEAVARGWYANPDDATQMRWWDGTRWTTFMTPSTSRRSAAAAAEPIVLDRSEEWGATPAPTTPSSPEPLRANDFAPAAHTAAPGQQFVVVRGTARAVQQRTFGGQVPTEMLSFRLEHYDSAGNRLRPVPVELRGATIIGGSRISGQLSDGDEVEVRGAWQAGTVRAESITNVSTGAVLRARSGLQDLSDAISGKAGKKIKKGVIIALATIGGLIALVITVLVVIIATASSNFEQQQEGSLKNWCLDIQDMGMDPPRDCDGVI